MNFFAVMTKENSKNGNLPFLYTNRAAAF